MSESEPPAFLVALFEQLRRRRFPIGIDDYIALRTALRAGFGLSSRMALRALCVSLWAKTAEEQEVVRSLFDQSAVDDWELLVEPEELLARPLPAANTRRQSRESRESTSAAQTAPEETTLEKFADNTSIPNLGPLKGGIGEFEKGRFVLVPQFPLTQREIAQAWRRLRRPVRSGPPIELDLDATVNRFSRMGILDGPVLIPPRRNAARLLLLIDRQGSMAPFHGYIDRIVDAIRITAQLHSVSVYYFHNIPVHSETQINSEFKYSGLTPEVDSVLSAIEPVANAQVYADPNLLSPRLLTEVLKDVDPSTAAVIVSDCGAARGTYDRSRLLDSIASLKVVLQHVAALVWLNPIGERSWPQTTAAQVARHVPMFALDRHGMDRAVNVLRGHPFLVDRAV